MDKVQLFAIFLFVIIAAAQAAQQVKEKEKEKPKKVELDKPKEDKTLTTKKQVNPRDEQHDAKKKQDKVKDDKVVKTNKHEERAGASNTQHNHHWRGPPFLQNATEQALEDYKNITCDKSLNKTAKEAAIATLIANQTAEVREAYSKFQADYVAKFAALSNEAQTAYNLTQAIKDDASLDEATKKTKLNAIKKGLSAKASQELKDFKSHYKGHKKCEWKDGQHRDHHDHDEGRHEHHCSKEESSEEIEATNVAPH